MTTEAAITTARSGTATLTQYIVKKTANDQQLAVLMSAIQHACKLAQQESMGKEAINACIGSMRRKQDYK